jgi:hypothetical protein
MLHLDTADQREWDDFEAAWCRGLELWAMENADHPDVGQVLHTASEHRHDYLATYRGVLGFAYLVLARAD